MPDSPTSDSLMHDPARRLFAVGAVLAGLGVGLGAFGAHGLEGVLPPSDLATFETAVRYQLLHGLALLGLSLASTLAVRPGLVRAGWIMVGGVAVFSGSLYALVASGVGVLGAVTPIGGLLLLAAWALSAWEVLRAPAA